MEYRTLGLSFFDLREYRRGQSLGHHRTVVGFQHWQLPGRREDGLTIDGTSQRPAENVNDRRGESDLTSTGPRH